MSIQQLSPNSVLANPVNVNPQVRTDQNLSGPQINQDAQKAIQAIKTDTVTISSAALQMLANDDNSATSGTREKTPDNASEKTEKRA